MYYLKCEDKNCAAYSRCGLFHCQARNAVLCCCGDVLIESSTNNLEEMNSLIFYSEYGKLDVQSVYKFYAYQENNFINQ